MFENLTKPINPNLTKIIKSLLSHDIRDISHNNTHKTSTNNINRDTSINFVNNIPQFNIISPSKLNISIDNDQKNNNNSMDNIIDDDIDISDSESDISGDMIIITNDYKDNFSDIDNNMDDIPINILQILDSDTDKDSDMNNMDNNNNNNNNNNYYSDSNHTSDYDESDDDYNPLIKKSKNTKSRATFSRRRYYCKDCQSSFYARRIKSHPKAVQHKCAVYGKGITRKIGAECGSCQVQHDGVCVTEHEEVDSDLENDWFTVNSTKVQLMVNDHNMDEKLSIIALCFARNNIDEALQYINNGKVKIRKGGNKKNNKKTPIKAEPTPSKISKTSKTSPKRVSNQKSNDNNNNNIKNEDIGLTTKGQPRKRKRNMHEAKLYKCNDCGNEFKAKRLSQPVHTLAIMHQCKSYHNKQIRRIPSYIYSKDKCNGNHTGPCIIPLEPDPSPSVKEESHNIENNHDPPKKKQKIADNGNDLMDMNNNDSIYTSDTDGSPLSTQLPSLHHINNLVTIKNIATNLHINNLSNNNNDSDNTKCILCYHDFNSHIKLRNHYRHQHSMHINT